MFVSVFSQYAQPKRHDLHVAACANPADGVLFEATFNLYQTQHQSRVQPSTFAFVPNGLQKFFARLKVPFLGFKRSLISPIQRRYWIYDGVSLNSGIGGSELCTALRMAMRTASASGSSICAPACDCSENNSNVGDKHADFSHFLRLLSVAFDVSESIHHCINISALDQAVTFAITC